MSRAGGDKPRRGLRAKQEAKQDSNQMFTLTFRANDTEEVPMSYQTYADALQRLSNLFELTTDPNAKSEIRDTETDEISSFKLQLWRIGHPKHHPKHI